VKADVERDVGLRGQVLGDGFRDEGVRLPPRQPDGAGKVERPWGQRWSPLVAMIGDGDAEGMATPVRSLRLHGDAHRLGVAETLASMDTSHSAGCPRRRLHGVLWSSVRRRCVPA
jgi:hypothetical protein